MSQTTSTSALTRFWNMSAPLHPLLIENSASEAEKNIYELQRAGFHCRPQTISSRKELLEHVARFPFDVVLSDYRLHGWTGIDAFSAMQAAGRDVPFILVTDTLGEEEAVECIKQGITDYVLKDHLARLPVVVARALEERALRDARQLMIQALRESDGNSLFLFAQNPLPMWIFEMATLRVLQVNDAALRHYGFTRDEFLRLRIGDLHPNEQVPGLTAEIRDTKLHHKLSGEWGHRKNDGSPIDVEMYLQKMEYCGVVAGLIVCQDVTERKRAEEEKQKFFTLVEYSRDFIAVADLEDNVEYVNPADRAMLGIPVEKSLTGTHSMDYVAPSELFLVHETILPALRTTGHWEGELQFRHYQTGRVLPMDFVGFQVKDQKTGQPRFVATVSRDVTERRVLERQLQQAQKFRSVWPACRRNCP
jgi:PAS domain S-box-containing protein